MSSSLGGGLSLADFDCYEPRKWKSNVYNRERLEVKQKLVALARAASGSALGADGSPLFIEASVEHPALWNHKQVDSQSVYFSRHEAARKELDGFIDRSKPMASLVDDPTPQHNHVFLAITVSHEQLEVSLRLHPDARVDRQNLERKLDDYYEAERMVGLLSALSPGYRVGITPELTPLSELGEGSVTLEALHEVIAKLPPGGALPMPGQVPRLFYIGIALPRSEAVGKTAEELAAFIGQHLTELATLYRFLAWSRDNDFVSMRQVLDKEKTVKRQRGLQKGDRVRVVRGMLAGKDGLVQEVDAKGHLKVLVGKMVVKIDAADVDRPQS
jgi:hypothetical protein